MEKFQETFNKWCDVNCQLAKDCKAYIKDTLNKLPNKEVILDDEEVITINYYGNHPDDCDHYPPAGRHRRESFENLYEAGACGAFAKRRTLHEQH